MSISAILSTTFDHRAPPSIPYPLILCCLVLITASQFVTLLPTTRPHLQINIDTMGKLVD
ncbi:hypothetical protein E2562_012900 [Oryza meyeriana var. granulata]|uniref:Uncharacterized protein n=1 Tax=Oryza meyeriana var. granulata TaxID=110450 RepID=A0A6G1CG83_9ORYZ|nr:hypothetical protein E2562_012900 [Oryza meyeriana var. granulata]